MGQLNRNVMLKTNVIDVKKRIDNLVSQFNEWTQDIEIASSISLLFYTSEEHPLTMGEVAHFLNSLSNVLDGCDVDWSSETDKTLNKQIMMVIIFNNR